MSFFKSIFIGCFIAFFCGSSTVFSQNTFPSSGDVGIGTNSPSTKLHVVKLDTGIKTQYGTLLIEDQDALIDLVSNSSDRWGSAINFIEGGSSSSNTDVWSIARQTTNGTGDSSLRFNFGSNNSHINNSKIVFTSTGRVGIGTLLPDSKLAVNGTIHSKEVKVDLNSWPDYVFKSDYNLPSLQDVKQFILNNGHLKDIPNELEVEKEGVLLGKMNAKLLQKIEELTLYLIAQNEELISLKKEVVELKMIVENK
ncbi:hypothetical protein DSM03_11714 [Leeuwenhoekiella aestuarii]|uniref:hypothetical protein n=1 Tax=Leeuwenhoekiella aestuarii TaxID=2249426 RepID=UPI000FFE37C0|nr:hypothetical protein [Leeuwenhoekiella aestuarii]RXG11377.1 hypothetical protein DSM03_11714 [Leeuwenhoekiella aestuarii]